MAFLKGAADRLAPLTATMFFTAALSDFTSAKTTEAYTHRPSAHVARTSDAGLTDAELVEVYRSYGDFILRWARRSFHGAVTPDDILQEVMILLLQRGATLLELQSKAQRMKWLRTTTIRAGLSMARRENRSAEASLPDTEPENTGARMHSRRSLAELMARLTEEERIIAILHFEEGMTKADVAERMRRSRPFIHKKLRHIRHRLVDADPSIARPHELPPDRM